MKTSFDCRVLILYKFNLGRFKTLTRWMVRIVRENGWRQPVKVNSLGSFVSMHIEIEDEAEREAGIFKINR